jgi:p-cumate 2,3-dioxygenase alpha subunit
LSEYVIDDRETPRFRVNRRAMVDPEVLQTERGRIFERCWLYVGHEAELPKPHDFRTRRVAGRPVIFTRDTVGAIQVFINSCTHRGAMLCREREGNGRFLKCFYHAWSFDTSGRLVAMPDDESYGPNFDRENLKLVSPPRVEAYRGFVFVSFDPAVEDLVSYLAGAREYLDLVCDQSDAGMEILAGTHEYSIRANWKLLVENSFDGYHAAPTHHRYFDMVQAAGVEIGGPRRSRGIALGNGHAVIAGGPGSGAIFGRPLSAAGQAEKAARFEALAARHGQGWVDRMSGSRNLLIFPNLIVIDLVMGVVVRKIDPVTPDYMEVSAWELVPPEEGPELRRQRLDNFLTFWGPGGLASPDDVEALECCQKAFAAYRELSWSDISRGMAREAPNGNDELQMRTFWRRWNEMVTGEVLPEEPHAPLPDAFRAEPKKGVLT